VKTYDIDVAQTEKPPHLDLTHATGCEHPRLRDHLTLVPSLRIAELGKCATARKRLLTTVTLLMNVDSLIQNKVTISNIKLILGPKFGLIPRVSGLPSVVI
jgi:hypothetical protein